MVKTTVILDDELYKQLVKEALEKYGTTRKLSFLINQKLKGRIEMKEEKKKIMEEMKELEMMGEEEEKMVKDEEMMEEEKLEVMRSWRKKRKSERGRDDRGKRE